MRFYLMCNLKYYICRSSPNHPSRHGKRSFIIASFCPYHVGVRIFPKNRFGSFPKIDLGRV
jgi:hypothetical protein